MTEPKLIWYWDMNMMYPDDRGFIWSPIGEYLYIVKCKTRLGPTWNVCRVEFDTNATKDQINQTMNTLLDVCRMRYADELLNQGEMK